MQTKKDRWQEDLFVSGPLSSLVPEDHLFKRVDKVLDFSWLHDAVRGCYCQDNGAPSVDPELALRLMLAGFFEGIVQDRKLMRRAQTDLAFRWFAGLRLDEKLPDRSSLTRIRQRWGEELFRAVFDRTVKQCVAAGLVNTDTVHIDATLIRADVSWESVTTRHVDEVLDANREEEGASDDGDPPRRARGRSRSNKPKKYSPTDPDATLATSSKHSRLAPAYKQHTAVEDHSGVIVDVTVTTGEVNEGKLLLEQIERIEAHTENTVKAVTCDAAYAHPANYKSLEERHTDAVIPPQRPATRKKGNQRIPARRFKYDTHNDRVTCPAGKHLQRSTYVASRNGAIYRARPSDCAACPLRARCFSSTAKARTVLIGEAYTALLRARRRKEKGWDETTREKYTRHRWRVEGVHGRSKTQHGLGRAARRGLANVRVQSYLTAAVMNLKHLATTLDAVQRRITHSLRPTGTPKPTLYALLDWWMSFYPRIQTTAAA